MLKDRRVVGAVAALVLLIVVVVIVLLSGDDDSGTPAASPSDSATSTSPSPTDESTAHEHDQVDTVDPNIHPEDYVEFCDAFYVFANAYSSAAADGDPGESTVLASAADDFRAVAAQTDLTDEVRAGFEWFVDDAQRIPNDATTEEQNAFSTFLNSACPA